MDALEAFEALLRQHLDDLQQNSLTTSSSYDRHVSEQADSALSDVQRRNRSNAHILLSGEARVLRHYIVLVSTALTYARGLVAQIPRILAARQQRLSSNSPAGKADADHAAEEVETRLGTIVAPAAGKRHHKQVGLYCKQVVLRLFKRKLANEIRLA